MHSTNYIIRFIVLITAVAALVLAFLATALKPRHDRNEAIYNKRAILSAVEIPLGRPVSSLSDDEVQEIFDTQMEQKVIDMNGDPVSEEKVLERGYKGPKAEHVDMAKERKRPEQARILPVFIFSASDGGKFYIVSVRGNGLWDEIWGNIAIEDDFNTIAGAAFDHKAETPGLGAEIKDNPSFPAQFVGKTIFDQDGDYESVQVVKGNAPDDAPHKVDGISGATITGNGVSEMMYRGIRYYEPYFESAKAN